MSVAVVTGAASGIGRAVCELILARGGSVVGVDLPGTALDWLDGRAQARTLAGDVASADLNDTAIALAENTFGRLDVVVLNAGIPARGAIDTIDLEVFERALDVNLRAVVLAMRYAVPAFRRSGGGSAVVTASVSGLGGEAGRWAYCTAKAGVINLVRSLAIDLGGDGIRVNAVCPGPVLTGMTRPLAALQPQRHEELRAAIPLQRWGQAAEVAEVIAFLASPAASFVTGVALPVDGGISCGNGQGRSPQRVAVAEFQE